MKIIQINCVYRKGSTGKIVYDLHSQLQSEQYESVVCYGRGNIVNEDNVYKVCNELYAKVNKVISMITGVMYGGCNFSTRKIISIINKECPDIVHLHCINGNFVNIYRLLNWLKVNRIRTVLTLHAEFMYTGGCGYAIDCNQWSTHEGCGHFSCPRWRKETKSLFFDNTHIMWKRMYKAFEGFEDNLIVVSVSPWLKERAERSPILNSFRHKMILNGLDCEIFKPKNVEMIRKQYGLTNEKIIFHASPKFDDSFDNIKGGYYVLKLAYELKDSNVKFFVAGNHPDDLQVPSNVILLGQVTNQNDLANFYSMADVTVLTSKRETFSMVVAESLSCGTPVVGFKAGAPEQITIKEFSDFSEYGNIEILKENVLRWLNTDADKIRISEVAAEKYSKNRMLQEYKNIYEEYVDERK